MILANTGHHGNSGIQQHSAGSTFPIREHFIGSPGRSLKLVASFQGVELSTYSESVHSANVAKLKRCEVIADIVWAAYAAGNGCSVNADGSGCPDSGYLAGRPGHELRTDCADFDYTVVYAYVFNKIDLIDFVADAGDAFCIGLWVHNGYAYLDVSRHFYSLDECTGYASEGGQIAIFDCANKSDIDVRYA